MINMLQAFKKSRCYKIGKSEAFLIPSTGLVRLPINPINTPSEKESTFISLSLSLRLIGIRIMSHLEASQLFSVKGKVAVVTGGGSGKQGNTHETNGPG